MALEIATTGCCAGHKCDNCATCRKGRCCRKDDPEYRLPTPDEWGAPIHGCVGVLATDGDTLQCHVCGEWFIGLNHHAWNAHNLLAREYKAYFGLNLNTPLVSPDVSAKLRSNGERLYERFGVPDDLHRTPEQNSHAAARKRSAQQVREQSERRTGRPLQQPNKTGYIGLKQQGSAWIAQLGTHQERRYIGTFPTAEEAARAYDARAKEMYGDQAHLNFPEEA